MPSKSRYNEGQRDGAFTAAMVLSLTAMLAHVATLVTGHGSYGTATTVVAVGFVITLIVRVGPR